MEKDKKDKRLRVLLLNAVILPGAGHLYLKRYLSGAAISVSFVAFALYVIVEFVLVFISFFSDGFKGLMQVGTFYVTLWEEASFRYSLYLTVVIWVGAIADSFRITGDK